MNIYTSKKVVAIGGGHGLGRMLAALKDFGSNATGIVATTDNGGSTDEFEIAKVASHGVIP